MEQIKAGPGAQPPGRHSSFRVLWVLIISILPHAFVFTSSLSTVSQAAPRTYLPADGVQGFNRLPHVLSHVESINDRVDFEGHSVIATPFPQFLKVLHVVDFSLAAANEDVDLLVEAVAGDGEDVQIFTCGKTIIVKHLPQGTRPLQLVLPPCDTTYLA